ncbi:hypothetical protein PINS_up006926 [Pythium insidiosum]|nr:hypothetical protein PINS_up006926 [Pythium insidiosum]
MTMAMVNVLVKNVYAPEDSQQLTLEETLSIRALKELLQRELPDHPTPSQQRLIFAGKICDDQQTLQTVLAGHAQDQRATANGDRDESEKQAPFVFHLMVTSPQSRRRTSTPPPVKTEKVVEAQNNTTPPTTERSTAPNAQAPPSELPVLTPPASTAPSATTAAPVNVTTPQWPFGSTAPPTSTPTTTAAPHHPQQHQQFHQQQQLFQQAFLMQQQLMILAQIQYLQQLKAHQEALTRAQSAQPATPQPGNVGHNPFLNFGFGVGLAGPPQAPAPAAAHHGAHNPLHHPAAAPQPMPAQVAAAPAAAAVPAAEPAAARGAFGQALREVLPLVDLRLAFKMAFMLFIIGQDAPQDRLIILGLMSFIGYLHTTGILAKIYEIYVRLSSANANAQNANANANADGDGNDAAAGAGVPGNGNAQGIAGPQGFERLLRISPDRGFFQDVRNFFAGFFFSLAPFWYPQPLNGDAPRVPREQPAMPDDFPLQGI